MQHSDTDSDLRDLAVEFPRHEALAVLVFTRIAMCSLAGYYATLGMIKNLTSAETLRLIFLVIGAVAVGVTALLRVVGMAATGPADGNLART